MRCPAPRLACIVRRGAAVVALDLAAQAPPEVAERLRAKGFLLVSATPLTRSSYHADRDFAALRAAREKALAA